METGRIQLTQALKDKAHQLGFELAGVTTPDFPASYPLYENWLAQGYNGEMAYLAAERARARRRDPRLILPECQSILVLGMRYADPASAPAAEGPAGRTASYAWGDDYHEVLPTKLDELLRWLAEQTGAPPPARYYTDSGPLLERDLATRAGLGWIGKNGCLIHPQHGSYFLLAEILLGIALEPDAPFVTDYCGSCTRCLEACPTSCILPDRTLDARRCLSYLTIELKGAIPAGLRPSLGEWVFGCDVCQQVCPWNLRFAAPSQEAAFQPQANIPHPDLIAELSLTPEEFNRKFKISPIRRAKRRGYLRNVCVVLGNLGDQAAIPALRGALLSEIEPLVRGHAAWALGQIGGEAAGAALEQAARAEMDSWVLGEIELVLGEL